MNIKIKAYGIAKEIISGSDIELAIEGVVNVGELKNTLCSRFPDFRKLNSLKFAVNADYQDDDFVLSEADEVVIIPPVSGG